MPDPEKIPARLEELRTEIRAERISYGELAELQGLAEHIEPGDVELLQWAGVPEFPEDDEINVAVTYTFVVAVPKDHTPTDVAEAVREYMGSVGHVLDSPVSVTEV